MKLILLLPALLLISCTHPAIKIDEARDQNLDLLIKDANYCGIKEDCRVIQGKCPFGCQILVKDFEVDRITKLIEDYDSDCKQDCIAIQDYDCVKYKCVPK